VRPYKIQPEPQYSIYAGWVGEDLQLLAKRYDSLFIIILFDAKGDIIEIIEKPLNEMKGETEWEFLENRFQKPGIKIDAIAIKTFFLEKYDIGIRDLTWDFEDFLKHEKEYSEKERIDYYYMISQWRLSGNFVFWWKNDFWCDSEGFIIAS
jgi:hypothetical protein